MPGTFEPTLFRATEPPLILRSLPQAGVSKDGPHDVLNCSPEIA
jgi:hypothetical protein